MCKTEFIQHFIDPLAQFPVGVFRRQAELCGIHQGHIHGIGASQKIFLGDNADLVFHLIVVFVYINAAVQNLCLGGFIAGHRIDEGRFAGTRSAQQENQMTRFDRQIDIPQQYLFLVPGDVDRTLIDTDDQVFAEPG